MNKTALLFFNFLINFQVFGKEGLVVTPLNSPVKEEFLKLKLEGLGTIREILLRPKDGETEQKVGFIRENNHYIAKFKTSHLSPGIYEYKILVKNGSGNFFSFNKSITGFITFKIDPYLSVKDPGEEGKKTLSGIDVDNNDVRDDIQRWALEQFPDSPSIREAIYQKTRNMKRMLEKSRDSEFQRKIIAPEISKAAACMSWITPKFVEISRALDFKLMNTETRVKARLEAEYQMGTVSSPEEVVMTEWEDSYKFCKFEAKKE